MHILTLEILITNSHMSEVLKTKLVFIFFLATNVFSSLILAYFPVLVFSLWEKHVMILFIECLKYTCAVPNKNHEYSTLEVPSNTKSKFKAFKFLRNFF